MSDESNRDASVLVVGGDDVVTERVTERLSERLSERPGGRAVALRGTAFRGPVDEDLGPTLDLVRPATIVYLAISRLDARGLPDAEEAGALAVLAARARVSRLVVVASSEVFEPDCRHPALVDEAWTTTLRDGDSPLAAAWATLEQTLTSMADDRSTPRLALLRAAPVLDPRGRDVFSRLLRAPRAVVPAGFDPSLQLLDPDDLARAVDTVLDSSETGIFHVAPAGSVPTRAALRLAGVGRRGGLGPARALLRVLGDAESRDVSNLVEPYLRYSFTVKGRRLAEMGFRPRWRSDEAIRRFCGQEEDAALGDSEPKHAERFDDFGMDRGYIDAKGRGLFGFLHDRYWRIEARGVGHVPIEGPGVLVGIHRGHQPYDGVMLLHLLSTRLGRYPRFLIHPSLSKPPYLADFMTKLGGILASRENADHILENGGLLALFPEGIQGAFASYRDAYRLRRFGRHEYVRMALRHQVPLVPFVTVGSAEIFPILAKVHWPAFERYTLWPCLPITPTMSTVPLPSKWHTEILEPIHLSRVYSPETAEDSKAVRAIGREVKALMAARLDELVARRKHRFWGSIWNETGAETGVETAP